MGELQGELAKVEAQIKAINHAMLEAAKQPLGKGLNTQFINKYAAEMQNARKTLLSAVEAQGNFGVQSMKVASQADRLTEMIQRQKFGVKQLAQEHKNLGEVYAKQMALQKSYVMQWGRTSNGMIQADMFTPHRIDAVGNSWKELSRRIGFYNQVLGSVADQTVKWGKNTQWAGRQLTAGITMPLMAAAAGMGILAYQIDKGLTQVVKVYGDASTQYEGMTSQIREETMSTAKQLASVYGQSAKDSIDITAQLAATGKTGLELQTATTEVTRARTLGELNLQDAMNATITLQSVYQMNSQKLGETFDFMNSMENQTNLTMQDFVVGIPKVVGVLKEFGGTVQDAGILLAGMKAAGIDAAEGANAIKSMSFKIISPNQGSKDMFQQMTGKSFEDTMKGTNGVVERLVKLSEVMKGLDQTQRVGLIQKMFGLYQGSKALSLLDQLTSGSEQMTKAYQVASQSAGQWADTAQGELTKLQSSAWNRLKANWESLKANLAEAGQVFLEMGIPILNTINKIAAAFNGLSPAVKKMISVGAVIVAAIGPLVMLAGLMGNLIGNVAKFTTAIVGLAFKFKILNEEQVIAARLAKQDTASAVMTEAEAFKILTTQINAATASLIEMNTIQGQANFVGAQSGAQKVFQSQKGTPVVATSGGRVRPAGKHEVASQYAADREMAFAANAARPVEQSSKIAENAVKTERNWGKIAGHATVFGVAGAAAATSMATESGSTLNNIANAAFIGTALMPLIAKIPLISRGVSAMGAFASKGGPLLTRVVSPLSKIGPALMAGVAALGPVGWAAAAAVAAVGGAWYIVNKNIKQSRKEADAFNNDIEAYAKTIGFTYVEAGTRVTSAGDKIQNLTDKVAAFKKASGDAAKEFDRLSTSLSEDQKVQMAINEGQKAALHGANQKQAEEAVRIALGALNSAMSKLPDDLLRIKIHNLFDFGNLDAVANEQVSKMSDAMQRAAQGKFQQGKSESIARWFTGQDDLNQGGASAIEAAAKDMWSIFSQASQKEQSKAFDDIANSVMKQQDELFNTLQSKHGKDFSAAGVNTADQLAQFVRMNPQLLGQVQGGLGMSNDEINNLKRTIDATSVAIDTFGGKAGIAQEKLKGMVDFRQMKPFIGGMEDAEQAMKNIQAASAQYSKWLDDNKKARINLTDAEKLARLNLLRVSVGLTKVTDLHKGFTDVIEQNTGAVKENVKALQTQAAFQDAFKSPTGIGNPGAISEDPAQLMEAYKSAYSGAMDDIYSSASDIMQRQQSATLDGIKASFDAQGAALQAAADKAKETHDNQRKALNKAYDARIQKVKDAIKIEQDAEAMRQKIFEAEKTRIQRLADMYNRNIDINAAITTGKLDDAAKLTNDANATQAGWNADDAAAASQSASDKKIESLNKSMDAIDKERQARLDSIDAVEKAEGKAFDKKKKALDQQQKNAEAAAKAETDADTRGLNARLAALKAFVPRNEGELQAHIKKVEAAYAAYGINLTAKGTGWGKVVGSALQNSVNIATVKMSNDVAWDALGKVAANQMSQGMFGMSMADFMKWVTTGATPKGYNASSLSSKLSNTDIQRITGGDKKLIGDLRHQGLHSGGIVGKSEGSRTGFAGKNQSQSEVWINALKGESVLNRKATGMLGADFVDMANNGLLPKNIGGPDLMSGVGGMMGVMLAGVMKRAAASGMLSADVIRNAIEAGSAGFSYAATNKGAGKYGGTMFSTEQLNNAGTIASTAKGLGASNRDIMIALMTAMQESSLRNLNYGDRDSLGLFQQRAAWGDAKDRTNAAAATKMFFEGGKQGQRGLFDIKDRGKMTMGQAAQAVQVSAFPGAYDQWSDEASAILSAMTFKSAGGQALTVSPGGWVRPAAGPRTSPFGMRINPVTGQYKLHAGSDIGAPTGAPIHAAKAGKVISTSDPAHSGGYGNYTVVDHGNGQRTAYAHQSKFAVKPGQSVMAGQTIGYVGTTGNSTGPHLHFEYLKNGVRVNPNQIIPGLKTGGFAMSDGLANLHKGEAVLPARLTEQFKQNVANSTTNGYNVTMDFNGAVFDTQIDFETGVKNALLAIEKRNGANRRVG